MTTTTKCRLLVKEGGLRGTNRSTSQNCGERPLATLIVEIDLNRTKKIVFQEANLNFSSLYH